MLLKNLNCYFKHSINNDTEIWQSQRTDWHKNVLLLMGRLNLPFDDASITIIKRFVASPLVKVDVWFATFHHFFFFFYHLADYLDLTFIIDSGGKLSTRLYDKRDDFDFHIVNFPFLSSNIPSGPSYGVYISQLIRYARCCSHYDDFRYRHKCLVDRLLSQGYKALRLEKSFKKFYGRYQDLIEKYRRSVNAMVSNSFPGQFLFNM